MADTTNTTTVHFPIPTFNVDSPIEVFDLGTGDAVATDGGAESH